MKVTQTALRRPLAFTAALALAVVGILPAFSFSSVSAVTNQVSSRSMVLSDSTASAANVTYAMTFTVPDDAQSLVVDFCAQSPIIGGACTQPAGMSVASGDFQATYAPTGNFPIPSGVGSQPTGWSKDVFSDTGNSHLQIKASGASTKLNGGTTYTFYFTGITNPSAINTPPAGSNTFYARVYTYSNNSYGATPYSNAAAPGSYQDYGGFALSLANNVTITAIVMETLGFCVSKVAPSAGCGAAATGSTAVTAPALTLGHGTPQAIDTSAVDTDTAYTQLSTNALHGAVVALKTTSSATCAGLSRDNGISCGVPSHSDRTNPITKGTANFGLLVGPGAIAPLSTYTGSPTVVAPTSNSYDGVGTGANTSGNYYLSDIAATNTFGDVIEASTQACQDINNQLTYAATASATTPAGVYSTTQALIATGTF